MLKAENNLERFDPPPPHPSAFLFLIPSPPPSASIPFHLFARLPSPLPLHFLTLAPPRVTRCRQFHDCWLIYISAIMGTYEYVRRRSLAAGHLPIQPAYLCVCVRGPVWTLCRNSVCAACSAAVHSVCVALSASRKDGTAGLCECAAAELRFLSSAPRGHAVVLEYEGGGGTRWKKSQSIFHESKNLKAHTFYLPLSPNTVYKWIISGELTDAHGMKYSVAEAESLVTQFLQSRSKKVFSPHPLCVLSWFSTSCLSLHPALFVCVRLRLIWSVSVAYRQLSVLLQCCLLSRPQPVFSCGIVFVIIFFWNRLRAPACYHYSLHFYVSIRPCHGLDFCHLSYPVLFW